MKRTVKIVAAVILISIGLFVGYIGFEYARLVFAGLPERIIVIPKDYEGIIYLLEDREHGLDLSIDGFWRRSVTITIPDSGILILRDTTPFHWITREKVMLSDGTIIDGTGSYSHQPSRFRHLGSSYRGGLPAGHALEQYKNKDGSIEYSAMEASRTPRFDNYK